MPGETRTSAALELARTILRRAERRAVTLERADLVPGPHLLPYLNRLADLLWVLARAAEQAEARTADGGSGPGARRPALSRRRRRPATRRRAALLRLRHTLGNREPSSDLAMEAHHR